MVWKTVIATVVGLCLSANLALAQVPWVKYSYFKNYGGLNDQLSATEIADNEASDLQNIVFDTGGALKKRYGYDSIPSDIVGKVATGTTIAVTGLSFYQQDDGDRYLVAIASVDSKAVAMKKDYGVGGGLEGGAWDNIDAAILPSNYNYNDQPDFSVAENSLIITIPAVAQSKPFKYTGTGRVTSLTSDTDCPTATLNEYHKNHLFLAGNSTYPSRVYFSAIDDITDYTATDFFDVQTADGTKVRALLSAYGNLYVFKDKSIWRLAGNERDTFYLEQMVSGIGTLSHNSVQMVNNKIYFTTAQNDIAVYDGAYTVQFLSQKIRQTISSLNFSRANHNLGAAFSSYKYQDQDYYCALSTAGSSYNDRILLFDTAYNAWTKFDNLKPNAWCIGDNDVGQNILIFGDTNGYVYSYPSDTFYDGNVATNPINAFYQTKWFKYSDISLGDKYWRRVKTYALSETTADTNLIIEMKADYEASGKVAEIDISQSGALWDFAYWDDAEWAGQSLIVDTQEPERGTQMYQIRYSNDELNKSFTIFGFEMFVEPTERI